MLWKEEYSTGIDLIDEQHKELFRLLEEITAIYKNDFITDKYDKIVASVDELRAYTEYHFDSEEAYMESIGYRRLFSQKVAHMEFKDRISKIDLKELDIDQSKAILGIIGVLTDWLVTHILKTDKLIGK